MKSFLFDVAVLMGRLFMAFFFLLMVVIAIPLGILATLIVLIDDIFTWLLNKSKNN